MQNEPESWKHWWHVLPDRFHGELPKISPGEVNLFSHVTPTRIEAKNKGISSLRMKLLNIQTLVMVNGLIDRSTIAGPPSRGSGILKWGQKTTFATRYL
jgi:hypothetical protein